MIGLTKGIVAIAPYDENWVSEFAKEKKVLLGLLNEYQLQIEHVGSTAIPGLSAKPIVDMALGVKDEKTMFEVKEVLKSRGYYFKEETKNEIGSDGHIFAAREAYERHRTHHIHIEIIGSKYWNDHMVFKKYLIEHPKYMKKYEKLKKKLVKQFVGDREGYTVAKEEFITSLLKKAYLIYNI